MSKITKKVKFTFSLPILFFILSLIHSLSVLSQTDSLEIKIGQMLLVGFRGTDSNSTGTKEILRDIKKYHLGGLIFFNYDVPSKSQVRNIVSPSQLKDLIRVLQNASSCPLWISIDQEGGNVSRLKTKAGFPSTVTPKYLGSLQQADSTLFYARLTAKTLSSLGFNVNFAPSVDLDINPDNPIIGKLGRSFSDDPGTVIENAQLWIKGQSESNIVSCLKHFPGHGSSKNDSHHGVVDISNTWKGEELLPYQELIANGKIDMVMVAHVFLSPIDEKYPASLSKKTIEGILREQLQFEGVVVSDDLAMGAITKYYSLDSTLKLAILSGVDLLCLSNNGSTYDPKLAEKAFNAILNMVKNGEIPEEKIQASYERLIALKKKWKIIF